jgi:hypothetical protein
MDTVDKVLDISIPPINVFKMLAHYQHQPINSLIAKILCMTRQFKDHVRFSLSLKSLQKCVEDQTFLFTDVNVVLQVMTVNHQLQDVLQDALF